MYCYKEQIMESLTKLSEEMVLFQENGLSKSSWGSRAELSTGKHILSNISIVIRTYTALYAAPKAMGLNGRYQYLINTNLLNK